MKSATGPENPRRLVDEAGDVAELLRAADREFGENLDEPQAFRALERRRRRTRSLGSVALAAALVLGLGALAVRLQRAGEPVPVAALVTAEPLPAVPARALIPTPAPAPERPMPPTEVPAPRTDEQAVARSRDERGIARNRPAPRPASPKTTADCRAATSGGSGAPTVSRLGCYRSVADGDGLAAEAALFELARLTAAQPSRREQALVLLDEHGRRFPQGALRGEVAELRIRTLYELGRDAEALRASEEALGTPWGRVLSAKLHLLRGTIYDDRLGDCARAATEYVALVGEPTAEGDEAEFRRARCFERLGRSADAAAAYARYLNRPRPARARDAQARLDVLGGAPASLDGAEPGGPTPGPDQGAQAE